MSNNMQDVHNVITNSIISLIERTRNNGTLLWNNEAAATAFRPTHAVTGKPYNGVNRFHLGLATMVMGYKENKWVTYKQAKIQGWQVRKHQKSIVGSYYSSYTIENQETGEDEMRYFPRPFHLFNVAQLERYVPKVDKKAPVIATAENCEFIEIISRKTNVKFLPEMGDVSSYRRGKDVIQMPPKEHFTSNNAYYSAMVHQLAHSTMHKNRLGRADEYKALFKTNKDICLREELVAELGSAFLGAELGFLQENLEFHDSYIDSWLNLLKDDEKAIFKACADAQKAADYIIDNWVNDAVVAEEIERISA